MGYFGRVAARGHRVFVGDAVDAERLGIIKLKGPLRLGFHQYDRCPQVESAPPELQRVRSVMETAGFDVHKTEQAEKRVFLPQCEFRFMQVVFH
ncbi:hypothetical protein D3C71_1981520 [compost metagenome]